MKSIVSWRLLLLVNLLLSINVYADKVDPSDITRLYTTASIFVNDNSNIKVAGSLSGAYSETNQYMALFEYEMGNADKEGDFSADYISARAQYFQVLSTGTATMPKAGISLDYIDNDAGMNMIAVGLLGLVNPKWTNGFMVFPNIAYNQGEILDVDVDGMSANLFISRKLTENGTFIQIWPEYTHVSGSGKTAKSLNWNFSFGTPLTVDNSSWFNFKFTHGEASLSNNQITFDAPKSTSIYLGYKKYF